MAKTVTVVYNGRAAEVDRKGLPISALFTPDGSYVDSDVYVNGYANTDTVGDEGTYGKSIYATNVYGFEGFEGLAPMKGMTAKFGIFDRAIIVADEAAAAGTSNAGVTITIDDTDEFYWTQLAKVMGDFTVTVAAADAEGGDGGEG